MPVLTEKKGPRRVPRGCKKLGDRRSFLRNSRKCLFNCRSLGLRSRCYILVLRRYCNRRRLKNLRCSLCLQLKSKRRSREVRVRNRWRLQELVNSFMM